MNILVGILQVLRSEFRKFRILKFFNFHPCFLVMHAHLLSNETMTIDNYKRLTFDLLVVTVLIGLPILIINIFEHIFLRNKRTRLSQLSYTASIRSNVLI